MKYLRLVLGFIAFLLGALIASEASLYVFGAFQDPEAINENQGGVDPFFTLFLFGIPVLIASSLSRLIVGWNSIENHRRNAVVISVALIIFLLIMLPPDDWGSFRGGVWQPASRSQQDAYDIWSAIGSVVGFLVIYFRWLFLNRR